MKRAKRFLNIAISSTVGVYLGTWLFAWWDFHRNPDLYAMSSAPWYVQMIPATVIAGGLILAEVLIFLLARWAIKGKTEES